MILLWVVIVIILLFLLTDQTKGLRFRVETNLDLSGLEASIRWLYPVLRVELSAHSDGTSFQVYLFKLKLIDGPIRPGGETGIRVNIIRLARAAELPRITLSAAYGLAEPYWTGILFAAAKVISSRAGIQEMSLCPDYLSNSFHLRMKADANLKIGKTILNYIKAKN